MVLGQYFRILWICLILIFATMTFFYSSQTVRRFSHSKVKQFFHHINTRLNVPIQMDNKTVMKSPIVHTAMSLNRDKFILFTHDVPKGSGKYMCMVNDKRIQGEQIFLNTFECDKPKNGTLQNGDILSIQTSLCETLPSIAVWVNRSTMKDLGYSKMTLCIVTMVKDEEKEVEDWIRYHLRQGVEAFIFYDNNSSDNTITILRRYKQVIVIDWPWQNTQEDASLHGILYTRGTCLWSLYMDIDEFLFPVASHRNLTIQRFITGFPSWLKLYNLMNDSTNIDQICFDRRAMGTSGYIKCPNLTVPEAYIHYIGWQRKGKCAIKPSEAAFMPAIHRFNVKGHTLIVSRSYLHIVHYSDQCWEHYIEKRKKGRSCNNPNWKKPQPNKSAPEAKWKQVGQVYTEFRDYCRKINQLPLPM